MQFATASAIAYHRWCYAADAVLQLIDPDSQQVLDSLPLEEVPPAVVTSVRFRGQVMTGDADQHNRSRSMLLVAKVNQVCPTRFVGHAVPVDLLRLASCMLGRHCCIGCHQQHPVLCRCLLAIPVLAFWMTWHACVPYRSQLRLHCAVAMALAAPKQAVNNPGLTGEPVVLLYIPWW